MSDVAALTAGLKLIFFDFDGVLVESNEIKIEAFRRLYAPHGEEVVRQVVEEHIRQEGISRVVKLERFHREFLGSDLDADALAVLAKDYGQMVEDAVVACDAVPGAAEALDAWRGRIPLYVVSGMPQDELRRIVRRRGIIDHFASVFGSPRLKPDIVRQVLEETGTAADAALFVGDSLTDFDAAKAAGTRFLGRVAIWRDSRFPPDTTITPDLWPLARAATG